MKFILIQWFLVIIALQTGFILGTITKVEKITESFSGNGYISSVTHQPVQSPTTTNPESVTLRVTTPSTNDSPPSSCQCGVASFGSGKIVGGTPVNKHNFWPWFATLVRTDRPTKVHCGASVISRRYVLTAAHCILPMIQAGIRNFKVKLGYHELMEKPENETISDEHDKTDIPIESIVVHPHYEHSYPFHYDIGLLKLSHPINCTNRIRPVCLPLSEYQDEKIYANETAIIAGFGRTSTNGNHSRMLQQVRLKLVAMSDCHHNFSKTPFHSPKLLDNMICAYNKGKDSCVGDSGGPMFFWKKSNRAKKSGRNETSSYFEQVGVTSWGIGCANENYPGVYSRVDKFLPWLKSVLQYDKM